MNDFIVWDKENNIFFDRESNFDKIYSKTDDEMYCPEEMYTNWVYYIFGFDILIDNNDRLTSHEYIGKTDIDNKKIYSDCSIVEFELKQNHPLEIYSKEYGFFKYSVETLSYYIELLNGNTLGFGRWENVKKLKL